ncbi:MAG: hypothetical protein JSR44_08615 [Spirochaetes bacterium]|nr:hypothetical protein [Spirochaetota bacterium]
MADFAALAKSALELAAATENVAELEPLLHLARARVVGIEGDLDFTPPISASWGAVVQKIVSARQAAKLIKPNQTILSTGFGGIARPSLFYIALATQAKKTLRPLKLTWVTVTAAGARGQAPGSIEELAHPGIIARYISAHIETVPTFITLAKTGKMVIHTLPQGVLTELVAAQTRGEKNVITTTGLGTFLDTEAPHGKGSLAFGDEPSLAERTADAIRYTIPTLDVVVITAAFADTDGNLYADGFAALSEIVDAAAAARQNGGKVIAVVQAVRESAGLKKILAADQVDHIVVHPQYEQLGGLALEHAWNIFLPPNTSATNAAKKQAYAALRFVNTVAGITAKRNAISAILARVAACLVSENIKKGDVVNLGVGLPEEVGGIFCDAGLDSEVTFSVESGALGGAPAPGIFFGSAIYPERLESSYETFQRYKKELAVTVLGFLQIDAAGNVNVSKRGETAEGTIGPGGFIDICEGARTIIFVGSYMARGNTVVADERVTIATHGIPKLVPVLDEITFNARRALEKGKRVFYATDFGVMRLTEEGLELIQIFQGIDVREVERTLLIPLKVAKQLSTIDISVERSRFEIYDNRN